MKRLFKRLGLTLLLLVLLLIARPAWHLGMTAWNDPDSPVPPPAEGLTDASRMETAPVNQLRLSSHPGMLQIVVQNLLSNAVSYSPKQGKVIITGRRRAAKGGVELRISNTNTDLKSESIPHLFERFWRRSGSRSDGMHLGLGLSLAKECADSLGLDLAAELEDNEQLVTFVLREQANNDPAERA